MTRARREQRRRQRLVHAMEVTSMIARRVLIGGSILACAGYALASSSILGPPSIQTAAPGEAELPAEAETAHSAVLPLPERPELEAYDETPPLTLEDVWPSLTSLPATLSLPAAGIEKASITPYVEARDLRVTVSYDQYGNQSAPYEAVDPPTLDAIVFDSTTSKGTLTSESPETAALYCHSNTVEDPGICQYLGNVRGAKGDTPADLLVVETEWEVLTYAAMSNPVFVDKPKAQGDPDFGANYPQTIIMISCHRLDPALLAPNGSSIQNVYVFFELVSVESKVDVAELQWLVDHIL